MVGQGAPEVSSHELAMRQRAHEAVAYFEANYDQVAAHDGAAIPEVEILRYLVEGTDTPIGGVMLAANRVRLANPRRYPIDRTEVYSFTHTVLYATDFGRERINSPLTVARARQLCDDTGSDLDLLGELLIVVWSCGGNPSIGDFTQRWDLLDRDPEAFNESYHSLLVGGMLFAMLGGLTGAQAPQSSSGKKRLGRPKRRLLRR